MLFSTFMLNNFMLRFHFSYVSLITNIKTLSRHLAVLFDLSKIPDTGEKQLCFHAMCMLMGVGRIALFFISSAKCTQVTLPYLEFLLSGVFACRVLYLCSIWARSCVQSSRGSGRSGSSLSWGSYLYYLLAEQNNLPKLFYLCV